MAALYVFTSQRVFAICNNNSAKRNTTEQVVGWGALKEATKADVEFPGGNRIIRFGEAFLWALPWLLTFEHTPPFPLSNCIVSVLAQFVTFKSFQFR